MLVLQSASLLGATICPRARQLGKQSTYRHKHRRSWTRLPHLRFCPGLLRCAHRRHGPSKCTATRKAFLVSRVVLDHPCRAKRLATHIAGGNRPFIAMSLRWTRANELEGARWEPRLTGVAHLAAAVIEGWCVEIDHAELELRRVSRDTGQRKGRRGGRDRPT